MLLSPILPVPQLEAGAYTTTSPPDMSSLDDLESVYPLIDGSSSPSGCIPPTRSDSDVIHASFRIADYQPGPVLDVNMNLVEVDGCSDIMWTWYTSSSCADSSYSECFVLGGSVAADDDYYRCHLRCPCPLSCDYFYMKSSRVSWVNQTEYSVCEVELVYSLIENDGVIHAG